MSIIYETLNRLEMEGLAQTDDADKTRAPSPPRRSIGFPMSVMAAFMVVAFVGMGLVLWYWGNSLDGSDLRRLSNTDTQGVPSERSDPLVAPASLADQTFPQPQPTMLSWEEAKAEPEPTTPLEQGSVEVAAEIVEEPTQGDERLAEPEENGKSLDVAGVETVIVADPIPTSNPAPAPPDERRAQLPEVSTHAHSGRHAAASGGTKPSNVAGPSPKANLAVPHKQKQKAEVAPSDNTAEPDRVDETVEDARMLLSRGQFQQALVALERLSPAPEGRVDFWLIKGSAHLAMGQLDSADKALASAQLLAPTNAQIAVQRAILQQEKGDHAAALEILKTAALRNPDVPEVFLNQGYSEQALGSVRDARRSFRIFLNITEGRSLYADQRESVNRWLAQFSSASN